MSSFASLLILAAVAAPSSQPRQPDAVDVFHCDFGPSWDVNYDGWPDRWHRTFGPGLPRYVDVAIEEDPTARFGRCLTVDVNGGGARLESPGAAVSGSFSYKIESRLKLTRLQHAKVQVRAEFCDDENQVLQTASSEWFSSTDGWAHFQIGPIHPSDERIRLARVALVVEPGDRPDLTGRVSLDGVSIARLPKMKVSTTNPLNVYADKDEVEVACELSGFPDSHPEILFELLDAHGQKLQETRVHVEGRLIAERKQKGAEQLSVAPEQHAAYEGKAAWRPPIDKHGYYQVRVTMQTARGLLDERIVSLAFVPPLDQPPHGEFGWSLAEHDLPLNFKDVARLLPLVAVNWVKMPVWYGEADVKRGDELVILAEKLAAEDIELVGVLDRPPTGSELADRLSEDATIADTFATDPASWLPLLDPVLTRLSLRVRWWQLGADEDCSLSGLGNLERELRKLREKLFRFGQQVNLGLGWNWSRAPNEGAQATWQFQQFSASPTLTGGELGAYLDMEARPSVRRWVLVRPLPQGQYDLSTRARDLVEQMLAAKIHGADAIFAADPFDDQCGLMTEEGAPGELLLPWRTAASLLSAAKFMGSMQLPQGSHNRLFETAAGDVLMVVWADEPTREVIYLGDHVRVMDVWGREQQPRQHDNRQEIGVDTLPKFVVGLNPHIARWRMAARFTSTHVPSVFGKSHPNQIEFRNSFLQGVGGSVELVGPKGWQVSPQRIDFKLAAGEATAKPFETALPFDASSGKAPIRADFTVDAERQYAFSIFLELVVGDGQVEVETNTRLEDDGALVVEQRMTNHSDALVDFKCLLYAPGRRRQRTQVFRLGGSQDVKTYRYPDGAQLLGAELWLRAEEVNGSRVLNHRIPVEQ